MYDYIYWFIYDNTDKLSLLIYTVYGQRTVMEAITNCWHINAFPLRFLNHKTKVLPNTKLKIKGVYILASCLFQGLKQFLQEVLSWLL